jgi:tRNA 5-methylaminomethyl-2-thiouridine biosynthesis bifunctional protein
MPPALSPIMLDALRARVAAEGLGRGVLLLALPPGADVAAAFHAAAGVWRASPPRRAPRVVITLEPALPADGTVPATPDLHRIDVEPGLHWWRAGGDAVAWLGALQAEVDAFIWAAPWPVAQGRMWATALARLATPGAALVGADLDADARAALQAQGFDFDGAQVATYRPRFRPPAPLAWRDGPAALRAGHRHALIIGGGLAGAAAAWALARQGWRSTVLDRQPRPAMETSGNPGGLMHGIFNQPDSLHSRWFRTAALRTAQVARSWVDTGQVAGALDGFLRLEPRLADDTARQRLAASGLPPDWLQWCDVDAARAAAQLPLPSGGWCFASGGWLAPADLARAWLDAAGAQADWRGGIAVARVERDPAGGWQALDAAGQVIAQAPVLVLAGGVDTAMLRPAGAAPWPMSPVRGQTTVLDAEQAHALGVPTVNAHALPVAGQGYALALPAGRWMLGATSQHDDAEPALRPADHHHNLRRAAALGLLDAARVEACIAGGDVAALGGRVGWRAITPDRLPVAGPLIDGAALQALRGSPDRRTRLDAPRHLPRLTGPDHGLYALTGLGSRGITSAALAAEVLAAWISGAPCPVPQDLRDALDPARFAV